MRILLSIDDSDWTEIWSAGAGDSGSFERYLWKFVDGKPLQPRRRGLREIPARSEVSDALSADLKRRGFKFVGSTILYAFMQAVGMVNDHTRDCFRYRDLA